MNTTLYTYDTAAGKLITNPDAVRLASEAAFVRAKQAVADAAYAGTVWAKLFIDTPWVDSLRVTINGEHEYDDQGGTRLYMYPSVRAVDVVDGAELPEGAELDPDGWLDDEVRDANDDGGLTQPWRERELFDESYTLRRESVAQLLSSPFVDGWPVFRALFPEFAATLWAEYEHAASRVAA
ncbi:hypothetical protein [Caldimonas sp. KR1-144]|uniref:hypothetical protein n=1 Tax=Caldimonas sp. KR1-144 TaxID=3400911 RepID=UPI003C01A260